MFADSILWVSNPTRKLLELSASAKIKGVASGKQSFHEHCANIVQRNAFRGHSTKYKCLENFALYCIMNV